MLKSAAFWHLFGRFREWLYENYQKMGEPAIDAVDRSDDFGGLIGSLGDGGPDPAALVAGSQSIQLEGGPGGLPGTLDRKAAIDGRLGDRVGAQDAVALVDRLPRAHEEIPVG